MTARCDPAIRFPRFVTPEPTTGCWLWTGSQNGAGYGTLKSCGRTLLAHRLSWELAHGPIPPGMWVLHRCDNPPCANPDHLFLGTCADNNRDMTAKGRLKSGLPPVRIGDDHPGARLTTAKAREILVRYTAGDGSFLSLGREYGVDAAVIERIAKGRAWRHCMSDRERAALPYRATKPVGSACPGAKLTSDKVREIRSRHAAGERNRAALAAAYGVSQGVIQRIVARQTWKHVA